MFSKIASGSNMRFLKQTSKISQSLKSFRHFSSYGSRVYTTGSASGTFSFKVFYWIASHFQYGFAVAAGLGCGAALLYGNRLFAVEVGHYNRDSLNRTKNLWVFLVLILTVLARKICILELVVILCIAMPASIPALRNIISLRVATN